MSPDTHRRLQFWTDQRMSGDEIALITGETPRDILDWQAQHYTPAGVPKHKAAFYFERAVRNDEAVAA
jgi:hypothetical protein